MPPRFLGTARGPVVKSAEAEIRDRIAKRGRITFAEFMDVALYHPSGGYYTSASRIGAAGDYFTSPTAHPAFGALLCVQLNRMWEVLGRPDRYVVVEMGAGSGQLGCDVAGYAATLAGDFVRSLRYIALERYARAGPSRGEARNMHRVIGGADSVPIRGVVGCFISNELVDSFPVHRFQIKRRDVYEIYLTLDAHGRLVEVLGEPSTPQLTGRLTALGFPLPDGFRGEIRLNTGRWLSQIHGALERGFVLTVDYGFEAERLYDDTRAEGTLQSYHHHTQVSGPYQRIGEQDITAHVDFSLLASEGEALGLRPLALLSQAEFLRGLGFEGMTTRLRAMDLSQRERDANVMGMRELVNPDGLGAFKVLIQELAAGVEDVAEVVPRGPPDGRLEVPLLSPAHVPLMEGRYPHLAAGVDELWPFDRQAQ